MTLHPAGYGQTLGKIRKTFDLIYEPETGDNPSFQVQNNRSVSTLIQLSQNLKLRNAQLQEKLEKDLQLNEAYHIMNDWLELP